MTCLGDMYTIVPKDDGTTVAAKVETALFHIVLVLFFPELPSY